MRYVLLYVCMLLVVFGSMALSIAGFVLSVAMSLQLIAAFPWIMSLASAAWNLFMILGLVFGVLISLGNAIQASK